MSLWSPVDLVNGSGSRNVKNNNNNSLTNGNTSRNNYEQILEQLNAKLFSNPQLNSDGKLRVSLWNSLRSSSTIVDYKSRLANHTFSPTSFMQSAASAKLHEKSNAQPVGPERKQCVRSAAATVDQPRRPKPAAAKRNVQ